jgi:hypothetical protein
MSFGAFGVIIAAAMILVTTSAAAGETLVRLDKAFDLSKVRVVGEANVILTTEQDNAALRVAIGRGTEVAGVSLPAPQGHWDLSEYTYLVADVTNVGKYAVKVRCRVDNPGVGPGFQMQFGIHPDASYVNGDTVIEPGQSGTVQVELRRRKPDWVKVDLFGMVCYPWGQCQSSDPNTPGAIDAANVVNVFLYVRNAFYDQAFEISGIRGAGRYTPPPEILKDPDRFFPFIDEYGQYIHADWPGKIHSAEDFARGRDAEARDLAANPGPAGWDQYGGWKDGPTLKATGWFYVSKYNGKWWLVDPEGRLFISHGMDCVTSREGVTAIDDREKWFRNLPARDSEFGGFFTSGRGFPRGYYAGRTPTSFDFGRANLLRKYGKDWQTAFADLTHRRLRSWGLNTMGNWSDPAIYLQRKTPYTVNMAFRSKPMEGVENWWGKSPDPFDEDFRAQIRKAMAAQAETTARDPWCIGYFVGNEMEWGASDTDLAKMILASPEEQTAKKVFVEDLKAKYGTIEKLNAVWGTTHASWEALLQSTTPPDDKKAYADLAAFHARTCETYFKNVRDAVKEVAPNHLYLGCRFAGGYEPPSVMAAAAKYCDVVSFNVYRRTVGQYRLTADVDVPLLIGEYSFWGLDRGKFNKGGLTLEPMEDQAHRAEAYKEFVRSMLRNPQLVGCHWFKYMDQATTGRMDGENFQFGFLDIADTPYTETIEAARMIGEEMYGFRVSGR